MSPIAFVNGIEQNTLAITDRAVLYGDSIFETLVVRDQQPLLLEEHLQRLDASADALKIRYQKDALKKEINNLKLKSKVDSVMRITISRGEGGRGYSPAPNLDGTRILSLHALPDDLMEKRQQGITLGVSNVRLSQHVTLAGHKHGNRLEQVLASIENNSHDEVIMLDHEQHVICGSKSNLFVLIHDKWLTPKLALSGIAGVMRAHILSLMTTHQIAWQETNHLTLEDLNQAKAMFVSNSIIGIFPVRQYVSRSLESAKHCQSIMQWLNQSGTIA